jgi:hypothetical protein
MSAKDVSQDPLKQSDNWEATETHVTYTSVSTCADSEFCWRGFWIFWPAPQFNKNVSRCVCVCVNVIVLL